MVTNEQLTRLHRDVFVASKHMADLARDLLFISDVLHDMLARPPRSGLPSRVSGEVGSSSPEGELPLFSDGRSHDRDDVQGQEESN